VNTRAEPLQPHARAVLVTGGAGFIGQHVVRHLLEQGRTVRVLDDLSMGLRENVPARAELVVGDVRDPRCVSRAIGDMDAVVHLAARVSVRRSVDHMLDDAAVNVTGTLTVLAALANTRVRKFVLASSMAVYSDAPDGTRLHESSRIEPASPYGAGKLAAETYARVVCAHAGVDATVLRYFNTYGPGQALTPYVGVVTIFLNKLARGEPLVVFGDGLQSRDFVHVDDVARATCTALDARTHGRALNVGTGHATTVLSLARSLRDRIDPRVPIEHAPAQPGELRCAVADPRAITDVLGWSPRYPTPDIETIQRLL
jgi:UDP-glucose 4-epimerase